MKSESTLPLAGPRASQNDRQRIRRCNRAVSPPTLSSTAPYPPNKTATHDVQPCCLLRHDHRRRPGRPHRDDAPRGRRPEDRRGKRRPTFQTLVPPGGDFRIETSAPSTLRGSQPRWPWAPRSPEAPSAAAAAAPKPVADAQQRLVRWRNSTREAHSTSVCVAIFHRTSVASAPARRAWASRASRSTSRAPPSTASSRSSCARVATSPAATAPAASPSTARSSRTRTSPSSTPVSCAAMPPPARSSAHVARVH
jgi:hypothetical protein